MDIFGGLKKDELVKLTTDDIVDRWLKFKIQKLESPYNTLTFSTIPWNTLYIDISSMCNISALLIHFELGRTGGIFPYS